MNIALWALVAATGALNAVQSGSNAQLVRSIGHPWLVALLVSVVTTAAFAAALAVVGPQMPEMRRVVSAPWWAWTGGLCGAAYVVSTLFFADRLGAGIFTGLTVTAGIVSSIVIDHYGWVGFQQHSASWPRITGAILMVAGLSLVARF